MKRLRLRSWNRAHWLLGVLLLLGLGALLVTWTVATAQKATTAETAETSHFAFFARGFGGKCLDFGAPPQVSGSPVFIYDCNGTIAQQIRVEEINDRHDVLLRAGNRVIGVKLERVIAPSEHGATQVVTQLEAETPLELQDEKNRDTIFSLGQIFALDGDSIILTAHRDRVVKVQNNRGTNRTPLVLGPRELADNEFWTFVATDKSNRKPTSGFVRPQEKEFVKAVTDARPGTVIEVDTAISLKDLPPVHIPAGVTIRGNRRGANLGPELWAPNERDQNGDHPGMLSIAGDHVRVTGLRLRGPSRDANTRKPITAGIFVPDSFLGSIIDHNDLSDWTEAAIEIVGSNPDTHCSPTELVHRHTVRVVRNFIHHNQNWDGGGYGVVTSRGGYVSIEANTFLSNRHSIAGDGTSHSGYRSWANLVQSATPAYSDHGPQQEFDMHGTDPTSGGQHVGGVAGDYMDIDRNTFLAANRLNFYLRGTPCNRADFRRNVTLGSLEKVIKNLGDRGKLIVHGSEQFNVVPNPTTRLGVGDFDGDGRDDLFLATGAAWYYAPQGIAEWRFLNAQSDGIGTLHFGDFDGDGRTDVFTQRGRDWLVSWGGTSPWQKINESNPALSEFRIGDFVGDHRADVFYADGQRWWVSDGGVGPFIKTQDSGFRAAALGFGDFNGDGKTDVVGVVSGKWMVSLNATGSWAGFPLRAALTKTMAGLLIADFNGNGRSDVATAFAKTVSYDGRGGWAQLPAWLGRFAVVGRFDANPGADVLFFWTNDHHLGIQSAGVGAPIRHSRQHMR